jgi:dihydrofolate reductase
MTLILIAAHDASLVIGFQGKLPWHIPQDLAYFKQATLGFPILMGRRTFESIGEKPLKGRRNIVISSTGIWPNVEVYASLSLALRTLKDADKVFVVGGSRLYAEALPLADQLMMTLVKGVHPGDTYFPEYRSEIGSIWIEISRQTFDTHSFVTYQRRDSVPSVPSVP